ncbi:MAG: hypothetical protein ACTHJ4_05295 [Candidatus Nucleicultricaceae bacterium]
MSKYILIILSIFAFTTVTSISYARAYKEPDKGGAYAQKRMKQGAPKQATRGHVAARWSMGGNFKR